MNDLIQKLAEQATEYYSNGQERTFDKEKFAELIVRECASKADSSLRDWLHDNSGKTVGDKVREHFGVEE